MKVMQLIDSLDLGGAERVAVNYANMLSREIETSYLCVTRKEGKLKEKIDTKVSYYFVRKERTLDYKAVQRTIDYIRKERITIIHAHGTSFLFAFLIKRKHKTVKIIWHNHHGASLKYNFFKKTLLKKCVSYFNAIIVVNTSLKHWTQTHLNYPEKRCHYISNFVDFNSEGTPPKVELSGDPSERIVYLANLKHPKEHLLLIKAFKKLTATFPNATLQLVGRDYQDDYSTALRDLIAKERLATRVYIHGEQSDSEIYLNACSIGVIASSSEGLPMALLEYGRAGLAVLVTDVGQCAQVVSNKGLVVESGNSEKMAVALKTLLSNPERRIRYGDSFFEHVQSHYSLGVIRNKILTLYSEI